MDVYTESYKKFSTGMKMFNAVFLTNIPKNKAYTGLTRKKGSASVLNILNNKKVIPIYRNNI